MDPSSVDVKDTPETPDEAGRFDEDNSQGKKKKATGTRPIIVAQGRFGRTILSCDDGKTWRHDRAWDKEGDEQVCGRIGDMRCDSSCYFKNQDGGCSFRENCDCPHSPFSAKGITYGQGRFVATYGWGAPHKVITSTDGVNWKKVFSQKKAGVGGVDYGAGRFVLQGERPFHSFDGLEWEASVKPDFSDPETGEVVHSVRSSLFYDYDGGRFIAVANPALDVRISENGTDNWVRPSFYPDNCFQRISMYGNIVYGNNILLAVSNDVACRSLDGGDNWESQVIAPNLASRVLFDGKKFRVWSGKKGGYKMYTSTDGLNWESTSMVTEVGLSVPAVTPDGAFISTTHFWLGYERHQIYRSEDGLNWEKLSDEAAPPSHAIFEFANGMTDDPSVCED